MIVVVIIGILAMLAIFGVRKYLANAKSAEATNTIGAINRASVAAYERETSPSEIMVGKSSAVTLHNLCASSAAVPATDAAIQKKKYGANPAANVDYHIGAGAPPTGWVCLRFEMSEPQYYRYKYTLGAAAGLATNVTPPAGAGWLSEARGDLNGDGNFSGFITGGKIVNGQAITFTQVAQASPEE
jgi:type IV pilus assembly protein PilA